MCGIYGFISKNTTEQSLVQATDTLNLRGPDSGGYYFKSPLGLGHRRLSIIDLSTGNQPMFSEDKNIILIFNGEIYNILELKKEFLSLMPNRGTKYNHDMTIESNFIIEIKNLYEKYGYGRHGNPILYKIKELSLNK